MSTSTIEQKLQALEDRAALKTLVDTFSNLADTKDVTAQVLLFTEDATVSSVSSGQPGSSFKGRKEIGDAFAGYLANFETVYHINGQQTVELNGDTATGTAYCLVVLIADEAGKKIKNTSGVTYHDEYVRGDGKWLIAKRTPILPGEIVKSWANSTASENSACPGSPRRHPPPSCRPAVAAIQSEYSLLSAFPRSPQGPWHQFVLSERHQSCRSPARLCHQVLRFKLTNSASLFCFQPQ
ncbi:nuclear transport factor 2 family protein [Rhizobium laguerreae]|uniref:nuclear transport factor 2 family protein n=1 Tax=Rhizobium laguerreae TaxID=1076926 RepID=UPI001C8FF33C|nr:nuclear transport factor 2 family protein [Rhizobium laguerreae]